MIQNAFLKKYTPYIFALAAILILAVVLYYGTRGERRYTIDTAPPAKELMAAKEAYAVALAEAKKWQGDSQPVFLKTLGEVKDGKSDAWQAEFYSREYTAAQGGSENSPTRYNYLVTVRNKTIEKTEVAESGVWGSGLPSDWRDSAEVVRQFSATPNFKNETIKELNLYYDHAFQKWFWAVRTEKGVTGFEVR